MNVNHQREESPKRSIRRLLIANRGEIACRIIRSAQSMGITAIAVHSDVDRGAEHVALADLAYNLGGDQPSNSYLLIDKIITAAVATQADAIHPGYGFLAENAHFAKAVEKAGFIFVGPSAAAMEAMGDKSAAKTLMENAGVPLVPGYHGKDQDYETFKREAAKIGYPVLLKASAGGGGRGMQVVEEESHLKEALESAKRESKSAFGDDRMLVEKYIIKPRHVELQVFADEAGNTLYLNERDCSIQRRHQKVVEEAPAPGMTPELRQRMGEAAVRAAQSINYVGAGTVEFLLDARGEFFFMEMNTRLQVEHPITEFITHQDLVMWQINVAQGMNIPLKQSDVPLDGHAIEVRIYAEDPDRDFLPASGKLSLYREPFTSKESGRRVDSGVIEGDEISPFYDPMITKLIAWGENREEARLRLLAMMEETHIGGITTNLAFLERIIRHEGFAKADLDTDFIPRYRTDLFKDPDAPLSDHLWEVATLAWTLSESQCNRTDDPHSPWSETTGWRLNGTPEVKVNLRIGEIEHEAIINPQSVALNATWESDRLTLVENGIQHYYSAIRQADQWGDRLYLRYDGELYTISAIDAIEEAASAAVVDGGLVAPLNGSIVKIDVAVGDQVSKGDRLIVLEAMKMEHAILAPHDGEVMALFCAEGEMVNDGTILIELSEEASDE